MSIIRIIPALVDAAEAEIELDLATKRHKLAVEVAEEVPAARARTDLRVAEEAVKQAYGALADTVADAPDSRAKSAIMSGAMRAALRGLDDAVARLGRVEERRARLTTDGIYDDCPKRLGWGDCCLGEFDVGISCDWEREDGGEAGVGGALDEMFPDSIKVSPELPAATTGAGQEPRK